MRFHTALIFIVLMFTSHSHAETVDVTSGEHTDFTRIFLFTAPATPWVTAKNSNIIRVTNPKFVGSFDLSNVFDKINSERISSVRNITGGLEFKLNCDCILAVEPFGKVGTILDFRNADVSIISSDQEISVQNLGSSLWAPQTTDGREALSNRFKEEASPERRKANGNLGTDQVSRQSADSLDEIASIVSNSLNDLRQTISLPGRTKKTNVDSANINTRQDCEFSELFDARKWADERPIYEQINAAHSQDLTSSGALTTPDNRTLVKLYLAFSMFPEARQALRTPQNEEEQALSKLITILETVPSNTQPRIFIEGPCLSDAQIFNILGDPKSVYLSKERIVHIYKTLGGWPTELRKRTIDVLSKRVRNMEGNSNQEFNVGKISRSSDTSERNITRSVAHIH